MQVVLDTSTEVGYRGRIDLAVQMFKRNDCDTIITHGSDFVCIKFNEDERSSAIRAKFEKVLEESEIRYVVIARDDEGNSRCLTGSYTYSDNFEKMVMFKQKHSARAAAFRAKVPKGFTTSIETYLYRMANRCTLRIYYMIAGLKTDKGTLGFIRDSIAEGVLIPHYDRKGKPFVLLEDLAIFNGQSVTLRNQSGVEYKRIFDLKLLLHDGLIAFNSISDFVMRHPEFEVSEVKYLTKDTDGENRRIFYDLGADIYLDGDLREIAVKELHLQDWFA